jgi:uncharacterized protein YkwD
MSATTTNTATSTGTFHRVITALCALAVGLCLLAAPQFTSAASAAAAASARALPKTPASARIFATAMLHMLNTERRAHHLPRLSMNAKLIHSAHVHNLAMAKADEMSHQLPGEAFFADRISAEKAPDNGHRLNILDKSFRNIGIDVYFDKTHNKMWFTQDFGQHA